MSCAASRIISLSCWCTCWCEPLELDAVTALIPWVELVVLDEVVLDEVVLRVVELVVLVLEVVACAGRTLLTHMVSQPLNSWPLSVMPVRHRFCSPISRSRSSALKISIMSGLPSPFRSARTLGFDAGDAPLSLTLPVLTFETSSDALPYRKTLTAIGRSLMRQSGLMLILAAITVLGGWVVVVVVG